MTPRPWRQWRQCTLSRVVAAAAAATAPITAEAFLLRGRCRCDHYAALHLLCDWQKSEDRRRLRKENRFEANECAALWQHYRRPCVEYRYIIATVRSPLTIKDADNVQTLYAGSNPATLRVDSTCRWSRCLSRWVCLAVLGVLRPGAAVCAAR